MYFAQPVSAESCHAHVTSCSYVHNLIMYSSVVQLNTSDLMCIHSLILYSLSFMYNHDAAKSDDLCRPYGLQLLLFSPFSNVWQIYRIRYMYKLEMTAYN